MYVKKTTNCKATTHEYCCHNCDAVLIRRVADYDEISVEGFIGGFNDDFVMNFCPKCGKPIVDIYSKVPNYTGFVSDNPTTIEDCPVGLFKCNGELCMKTEYHDEIGGVYRPMAYIISTGERFCRYESDVFPVAITDVNT